MDNRVESVKYTLKLPVYTVTFWCLVAVLPNEVLQGTLSLATVVTVCIFHELVV